MKYGTYRNRLRTLLSARALLLGLLNGANEPAPTPDTTPTSSKPKKRRQRRTPMNTPREDVLRSLKSLFAPALIATNSVVNVDVCHVQVRVLFESWIPCHTPSNSER